MGIFLPKNEQHKLDQKKKEEYQRFQNMISGYSDELVDWLIGKGLSIAEFETVIQLTQERFRITFGTKKIKELKDDKIQS